MSATLFRVIAELSNRQYNERVQRFENVVENAKTYTADGSRIPKSAIMVVDTKWRNGYDMTNYHVYCVSSDQIEDAKKLLRLKIRSDHEYHKKRFEDVAANAAKIPTEQ